MSYMLIVAVLFFLGLNVYFRLKIIKIYKALKRKQINIDPGLLLSKTRLKAFAEQNHPSNAHEIMAFGRLLNRLVVVGLCGLLTILVLFLIIRYL